MKPAIRIVIVNYNAGEALTRCVLSVLEQELQVAVTVIDNASSDDSISRMQDAIGDSGNVTVIASSENPGFAKAVNTASRDLDDSTDYLLILNPDCELLALAGPAVVDGNGGVMRGTLRRFPDPWNSMLAVTGLWRLGRWFSAFRGIEIEGQLPTSTVTAEAVSGACMMLRAREYINAGCMDGAYGLHCEDLDLMYRLRERGFHCLFVPSARVYHQQGVSSASRPLWVYWQKHRGMQRFFLKFQAEKYVFPLRWLIVAGIWTRFILTLPLVWIRS
jgi:GT2 family glycosyltransferase